MSEIEKVLRKATQVRQRSNEPDQTYFERLTRAARGLTDDQWDEIPRDAQKWVNDCIDAIGKNVTLPEFPDDEAGDEPEEEKEEVVTAREDEDEGKSAKKRPPAKSVKGRTPAKAKAKEKEPEKETKAPKAKAAKSNGARREKAEKGENRKTGAQDFIKETVLDDPSINMDDLMNLLEKKGYSPTRLAVSTIRSGFLSSLRLINRKGKLKGVNLDK